jgi:hypothetical protein
MTAEISWRACCSAMAGDLAPPLLAASLPLTTGKATALPVRERREADAFHEAAHAAIGLALGWQIDTVTIDGPAHVRWRAGCRPLAEVAAVAMAGPIAERWRIRWIVRPDDKALMADLARVRGLAGGACDQCRAARAATVETGHAADAAVMARLREIEAWTIDAVRSPPRWRAIRAIAAELLVKGTLVDDAAEATCRPFFNPGELSPPPDWSPR